MRYSDIDRKVMEKANFPLLWGEGNQQLERCFFRDEHHIYKLWSNEYYVRKVVIDAGEFVEHKFSQLPSSIAAIDIGFVNEETCPALVDLIWDDDNICRGYVTRIGTPLVTMNEITQGFFDLIKAVSSRTGYIHSDFAPQNIIWIDGKLSLIDIDTVLSRASTLTLDFELERGSLRPHVYPAYRQFVLDAHYAAINL